MSEHEREMSEIHATIMSRLERFERDLEFHTGEGHAALMSGETIRSLVESAADDAAANARTNREANAVILDSLLGPVSPLSGERESTSGALHKIDTMWTQTMNGGIKSKLSPNERVFIAIIAGLASVLSAYLAG